MIHIPSGKKGERFYVSEDVTDYALIFPLEIPNTDAFTGNGVTSANKANSLITLTGKSKEPSYDIYYNGSGLFGDEDPGSNESIPLKKSMDGMQPIIALVSYTFFVFGLKNGGVPYCRYITDQSWNEVLQSLHINTL
jgi:hypothetical protein